MWTPSFCDGVLFQIKGVPHSVGQRNYDQKDLHIGSWARRSVPKIVNSTMVRLETFRFLCCLRELCVPQSNSQEIAMGDDASFKGELLKEDEEPGDLVARSDAQQSGRASAISAR